jgi:hypothetical protein
MWEESSRVALVGLALAWLGEDSVQGLAMGGVSIPSVEVTQKESVYHVRLRGEFELRVNGEVEFYKRMLVIFLGHLEVPGQGRGSRRTRDGWTPFVRQEQMAGWFGVPQPHISRWFRYWLEQDWQRMLSQKWGEVLTEEVRRRVIDSWVNFPWYSAQRMWDYLLKSRGAAGLGTSVSALMKRAR